MPQEMGDGNRKSTLCGGCVGNVRWLPGTHTGAPHIPPRDTGGQVATGSSDGGRVEDHREGEGGEGGEGGGG